MDFSKFLAELLSVISLNAPKGEAVAGQIGNLVATVDPATAPTVAALNVAVPEVVGMVTALATAVEAASHG